MTQRVEIGRSHRVLSGDGEGRSGTDDFVTLRKLSHSVKQSPSCSVKGQGAIWEAAADVMRLLL